MAPVTSAVLTMIEGFSMMMLYEWWVKSVSNVE